MIDLTDPSGFQYKEYYLYSQKMWEMAPSGVSFYNTQSAIRQNAPIVVTASGYETTTASQPWAQTDGVGKYQKLGFGYFHLLDNGQYDPDSREFALSPDSSGKIVFNGILRENVYIEYEAGISGYYIMSDVDYNPIRSEVQGGFVHFSQTTDPKTLFLTASQNSIRADGYRGCKLTATLFDEDFDRVPEKNIVFEIQSIFPARGPVGPTSDFWSEYGYLTPNVGYATIIDASGYNTAIVEQTNRRGECHVHYTTHDRKSGIVLVKAYYQPASGIFDQTTFAQYYLSSDPFTLDLSLLDTLDYLS